MNTSTVNSITPEESTNSTEHFIWPMGSLEKSVFFINALFGVPAHSYVIWLIVTGTGSGVASEFFNRSLSVCEIFCCLNCLLTLLSFICQSLKRVTQFLVGLGITGRSLFLCLICVERYLAVVHPVIFLKYKPLRYRMICSTVVWIITLGGSLACMFSLGSNSYFIFTWFFSVQFLVFFSIQLFCLVAVLRALKQSGPGERRREREEKNHMKRRAFYPFLINTVSMAIIFVPLIFSGFLSVSTLNNIEIHRAFDITSFIVGGFVQPVLYLHRTGKLPCLCLS